MSRIPQGRGRRSGAEHYQHVRTISTAALRAADTIRHLLPHEAPMGRPGTPREVLVCGRCQRPQLTGQGRRVFLEPDPIGGWRCVSRKACDQNIPSLN